MSRGRRRPNGGGGDGGDAANGTDVDSIDTRVRWWPAAVDDAEDDDESPDNTNSGAISHPQLLH